MNGQTVIETQDLTKVYGEQVAVNRLNLKINEGEVFGFLGPNGAGKTTTLIMLLGLSEPTSGKARVCGFDPTREALKVKRVVGYLPENVGFYDDINAVQNLLFISRLNGIPDEAALVKIEELLKMVDLKPEPKKKLGEYSRGMRQRLGIAEVLLKDPRAVFLDEPTLGLDPDGSRQMLELIHSLSRDKNITVFFSSHLLDQVQKISTRIGIMLKGNMVAVGRIEDLAKEKLGLDEGKFTLEELYMKYFKEGAAVKGIITICRKELADHFSSTRFTLLFYLILMVSMVIAFMVGTGLKEELKDVAKPTFVFLMLFTSPGKFLSLIQFISIFGPIIGIVLGFDAVNRERSSRTLSKLASQPIFRDYIINGKFLAGLVTIVIMQLAIVLMISGLGLLLIGVVPGPEEIYRMLIYLVISVFYIGFWLGISILFSVSFRSMATSALASIACWIFFFFFVPMGAGVLADAIAPVDVSQASQNPEMVIKHEETRKVISLVSPMTLYSEATTIILDPLRKTTQSLILMGPFERLSISRFQNPLPLWESIYIVLPHLISLIAITLVCFAISYAVFMRQEIRST